MYSTPGIQIRPRPGCAETSCTSSLLRNLRMASDLLLARVCASTRHRIRRYSIIRQRNRPMTKPVEAPKGISLKEKLLFSQQKRPFQLMAVRKPAAPGDRYDLSFPSHP